MKRKRVIAGPIKGQLIEVYEDRGDGAPTRRGDALGRVPARRANYETAPKPKGKGK